MNIVFNICLFRYAHACSMFKGEIWTAGGNSDHEDLDVVEVLTPSSPFTSTWRSGPKLTRERRCLTMESWKIVAAYFSGTGPPEETYNYRSYKLSRNLPAEKEKINKPRNLPFILII